MNLCIRYENQLYFVEKFMVIKRQDKFYITINSKYAISGLESEIFRDEQDVLDRLVECMTHNEVFNVEKEFNKTMTDLTFSASSMDNMFEPINSTENKVDAFDMSTTVEPAIDSLADSDIFGENSIDTIELDDVVDTTKFVDIVDTSSTQFLDNETDDEKDEEISVEFWDSISDTTEESTNNRILSIVEKQQKLYKEGKLTEEEINKINNTPSKYVNLVNTERINNRVDYFSNITNDSTVNRSKEDNKSKLSFRGILKLISLI